MNRVSNKTVEYLLNNRQLGKYHNNVYVIVEFRICHGGVPEYSICNTDVYYDKKRNLILGKNGSGIIPESLAVHSDNNNYIICKPDEIGALFEEWKNLSPIKDVRKRALQSHMDDLLIELNMLKMEIAKI
jgi:hypothetical protein